MTEAPDPEGPDPFDGDLDGEDDAAPPRPELGAWGQLAAAVLAVAALLGALLGLAAVLSWMFR
ncbi:MAG TPA: hypothetical protein VMR21_06895 [Vicinamibacteria bacterium]|nr:hypothetical protein [Vicinamibacteria bacterium]